MSVDIKWLKKQGISHGSYRKIFSAPPADYPKPIRELVNLISQRIRDGKNQNFRDWRTYAAIDYAYEVPFNQTTPTLINHVFSQNLDAEKTQAAIEAWGLNKENLFLQVPIASGGVKLVPNPPVFFQIFIPLVKAYIAIREAKIFNERNTSPLLPYKPLKSTEKNRVLCEIITDLIQTISVNFGYSAVMRQAIHQALKYGMMIAFPEEEWYVEEQVIDDGTEKGLTYTVKEGLRYILPHPTRMIYDMTRPATRINSDTGVEWGGTWYLRRYGDILDSGKYWNRKNIFMGTSWWAPGVSHNYFTEYYPCKMAFPPINPGPMKREDAAAYYSTGNRDQAIFMTEFFMKLIPSQWGLGEYKNGKLKATYDHPVWHRFTVAGDDTILWAAPCAYAPMWFMGYDYDEQSARTSSLGLETIPWQDHVGNILSQIILTAKQNLANVTFYDSNLVNKEDIDKLENLGETKYRSMNFVGFDSLNSTRAVPGGNGMRDAIIPVNLGKASIVELLQMLPMVLNIMERVLQISAQESGSAASHQQSKAEVLQTGGASQNRVLLTSSLIDEGIDAWKKQLYDATLAYHDAEISTQVSSDIPNLAEHLNELGFTVKAAGDKKVVVAGVKKALHLEGFAATNEGPDPQKEKEMAQVIFQVVGTVAGQPDLVKQVGADNLLTLLERAAIFAGAPKDFRLERKPAQEGGEGIDPQIVQAIQQAQQATMQAVAEKIAKPAAEQMAKGQHELDGLQQIVEQLKGIYDVAAAQQEKTNALKVKTAQDIERKNTEAAASIKRADTLAAAEIKRKDMVARADTAIKGATAAHDAHIETKKASKPTPAK